MKKAIFGVAMILLIFGVCLSFRDQTGGAFVTYGTAICCLIFAFLQDFKRFKGLGVEAEVLERKIEEADVILGHLRSISVPLAELLFTMVARLGRWDSAVPRRDAYRIMEGFEKALRGLNVPEDELVRAKADWHRYNLLDQARPIVGTLRTLLHEKAKRIMKAIEAFPSPISEKDQSLRAAEFEKSNAINKSADAALELLHVSDMTKCADLIRQFIRDCPHFSDDERSKLLVEQNEQLADLEYYGRTFEFRRLDVWFASEDEES